MRPGLRPGWAAVVLIGLFTLHAAFASSLCYRDWRPNLALTGLFLAALFAGPNAGAVMGFCTGLMEASFVCDDVGSFIVTRTLAGFAVGALEDRIYRDNIFVALVIVLQGTLLVHGCFFLVAPQPHALLYATRAAEECLYNGALAIPLFYLIRRLRTLQPRQAAV